MFNLIASVRHDGHISFGGIDFSNSKPITIAKQTKDIIVFKIPGGTYWSSMFAPRQPVPTRYKVCRIDSFKQCRNGDSEYHVTELVTFAPRDRSY